MNQIEILNEVEKQKKILERETKKPNEEVEFFTEFLDSNDLGRIKGIEEVKIIDLMIAFIKCTNPDLDFNWIVDCSRKSEPIIQQAMSDEFHAFLNGLNSIDEIDKTEELINILENNKAKFLSNIGIKKLLKDDPDLYPLLALYLKDTGASDQEFLSFLKLYNKVTDKETVFGFILAIKSMKETIIEFNKVLQEKTEEFEKEWKDKEKSKNLLAYIKMHYRLDGINKNFAMISNYTSRIESEQRNSIRKRNKEILNYNDFSRLFKMTITKEEITNEKELASKISDSSLRLEVLKFIYEYNLESYKETEKLYQTVSSDMKSSYQLLLKEYHITDANCNFENVMKRSIDEIKMILIQLKKWKLDRTDVLLKVLNSEDPSSFSFLSNCITSGILTEEFLENNLNLFYSESKEFLSFTKNINCMQTYGLNPVIFRNHNEILLEDAKVIEENMKVLSEYKLLKFMRTTEDYSFLLSENLNHKIDDILELGYEKNLEASLSLLNASEKKWKRIHLLKELSFLLEETEEIEEQLYTDSFLIPDNQIEDCIYNKVSSIFPKPLQESHEKKEEPQELKGYILTSRTYKIGDTIISRNKVKRNLATFEDYHVTDSQNLFYSIIYGSTLKEEEYQKLSNEIQGIQKKI